jgi:hypothetical protein
MPTDLCTIESWLWETGGGLLSQLRPAKAEVRSPSCELRSIRHSSFDIRTSPLPATVHFDAFGRIYERPECRIAKCES